MGAGGSSATACCGRSATPARQRAGRRRGRPTPTRPRRASARARCCAGHTGGQPRDLLGEGPPRTAGMVAEEPSDTQLDHHRHAADRRIGHPALVAAVDPRRRRCAPWTTRLRPGGARADEHSICDPFDPLGHCAYQLRVNARTDSRSHLRHDHQGAVPLIGRHAGASTITKCGPVNPAPATSGNGPRDGRSGGRFHVRGSKP